MFFFFFLKPKGGIFRWKFTDTFWDIWDFAWLFVRSPMHFNSNVICCFTYYAHYVSVEKALPLATRACVLPQSPSPAARSKALSSSWRCRRILHTASKTRRMTEERAPVEQHFCNDQDFSLNILRNIIINCNNVIMFQIVIILVNIIIFQMTIKSQIKSQRLHCNYELHKYVSDMFQSEANIFTSLK